MPAPAHQCTRRVQALQALLVSILAAALLCATPAVASGTAARQRPEPAPSGIFRAGAHLNPVFDVPGMHPVEPFVQHNATVGSPVDNHTQAELERLSQSGDAAGSFRSLLHFSHNRRRYKFSCPTCTLSRCSRSSCSGHCPVGRRFFTCQSRPFQALCDAPRTIAELMAADRGPDSMGEFDTAVVSTSGPNMGCAMIANRPDGCPEVGTPAVLPGGVRATVVKTICHAEYYLGGECDGVLLPFGVCECKYRSEPESGQEEGFRPRRFGGICRTTHFRSVPGYGVGSADGSPSADGLQVVAGPGGTETWFSNYTDIWDEPTYSYSVTSTTSRSVAVDLTLTFYRARTGFSTEDYMEEVFDYEH